jgi:hypothetical protein
MNATSNVTFAVIENAVLGVTGAFNAREQRWRELGWG